MKSQTNVIKTSLLFFCLLFLSTLKAQLTGKIEYPTLGISFEVPTGWVAQETDTGVLIKCETMPGFILILTHELNDMNGLEKDAKLPIADGNGTHLLLTGGLYKIQENALGGFYMGSINSEPYIAYIAGMINPYGKGITIMTATKTEAYTDQYKKTGLQLVASVDFYKPELAYNNSTNNSTWAEKLKNCRLTYMESYNSAGGGYGKKIKIDLCGQGYFNHSSYSSMGADTGGASAGYGSNNKGSGNWKAYVNSYGQDVLQLNFYNGEVYEFELTTNEDDETYLNGDRYFRTYEDAGNYAPNCY